MRKSVVVRVPATTANFGPAYDVMGMALDIWLELKVEVAEEFSMTIMGHGADTISADKDNMIVQATALIFKNASLEFPPLKFTVKSDIPFGCGCGSSSAAVVAGLMAGLALTRQEIPSIEGEQLLQLATAVEGHPDNAAPAIYGGVQISFFSEERFWTQRVSMPNNVNFVLFVPAKKMKQNTHVTRGMLPTSVSIKDAVHNMSRTALMCIAFQTGNLEPLRHCLDERFHQTPRRPLFPHMDPCIAAAMSAGAAYSFLSGAGPTVCALVPGRCGEPTIQSSSERAYQKVAEAMLAAARANGVDGFTLVTRASEVGAHIVNVDPSDDTADIRIHRSVGAQL